MYDVIIVGAGPAGSTAAKTLSESGYKVLLAERCKMPRNKSCSGVLIKKSMNLVQKYFNGSVPLSATCTPVDNRGMIFTDDNGKEYAFEQEGLNVWRSSFDNFLAQKAVEHGVELRDSTSVLTLEETDDYVTVTLRYNGETHTKKAKYIVDCSGVTGTLKNKLYGIKPQFITTYQTFNKGSIDLDYHYFYAYLQPELSEYDAWFNVKDYSLVFGVSAKDPKNIAHYYGRFIAYMKQRHNLIIEEEMREEKWLMPRIEKGCHIDYGKNRIFHAGEIAGFLNPMGEGISSGLESGYQIATAIANNFNDFEKIHAEYKVLTVGVKTYMERQWSFVGNMSSKFDYMKLW